MRLKFCMLLKAYGGFYPPKRRKRTKGAWGMPWLSETTKDVVSCEKLRGGANDL